jgi:serine/threonine protein kinase
MPEKQDLSAEVLLSPGKMIDKYQIVKLIGLGGMGAVYLAIDVDNEYDNAYVALKILYPKLARKSGDFTRRFLREARIASRIRHPNLVQVYDCNFCDEAELYFLAQEYVGGGSLRQLVSNDTVLSEVEALRVAIGVAQALCAVHEHKVVHRDIKPDNIMFASDGTIKLTDWGIAKQKSFSNNAAIAQLELTVNKVFMGTPLYAPPEQLQDSRNVDIRSDIYSLGATLYYSLVGKPPFRGTTEVDSLCAVLTKPAPDVRRARPDISDKFAALLLRMLAKSPADRPANPGVLLELLFDAGKKYDLQARLGAGISASAEAQQAGRPGQSPLAPAPHQITEATRRPEPWRAVRADDSGAAPRMSTGTPRIEPQPPPAGDSLSDISAATEQTLLPKPPLGQMPPPKPPLVQSSSAAEPQLPSQPAFFTGKTVLLLMIFLPTLAAVFFATEIWVDRETPERSFHHCMAMGDKSLQRHFYREAMFYFRGGGHITGFENDRRPGDGIAKASSGLEFKDKMTEAFCFLHREENKSRVDWEAIQRLVEGAMSLEGFEDNMTGLQMLDYCKRGRRYASILKNAQDAAKNGQWRSVAELCAKAMSIGEFENESEAKELYQQAKNYQSFEKLLSHALIVFDKASKSDQINDWQEAIDAFNAAKAVNGISVKDLSEIDKGLLEAKSGYNGALAKADKKKQEEIIEQNASKHKQLLSEGRGEMQDKNYLQAERKFAEALGIPGYEKDAETIRLLQAARDGRVHDLLAEGDNFSARKDWAGARSCYEKILSGALADGEIRRKADRQIIICYRAELVQLLDSGQEALQQKDWPRALEKSRQAEKMTSVSQETPDWLKTALQRGEFSEKRGPIYEMEQRAKCGLEFQKHFETGKKLRREKKYAPAIDFFVAALKVPGFEKHEETLEQLQQTRLLMREELKTADTKSFNELLKKAQDLLTAENFVEAERRYIEAGKIPGYSQDLRIKEGLEKCRNGLRYQNLQKAVTVALIEENWLEAEKLLLQALRLQNYQDDHRLQEQLKNVRGKIFQKHIFLGGAHFRDQHWREAAAEFDKALLVEGHANDSKVRELVKQCEEMLRWPGEIAEIKKDFEKILDHLQKTGYFKTGALKQDYIAELKNLWTEIGSCPVESIRRDSLEELWREKIMLGLRRVSEVLLYHTQVLALTDELQARERRDFLVMLAEVDEICQGRISSLGEKMELRANVTKFFQEDYAHPLLWDLNGLSKDLRQIPWLNELYLEGSPDFP